MGIFNPYIYFTTKEGIEPQPPVEAGLVEYLIVGGGGGGGSVGGGGGGGGVVSGSFNPLPGRLYNAIIGGGGNTGANLVEYRQGVSSSLFSIKAFGGGYGATRFDSASVGASGGGGSPYFTIGADGIYGYGNKGGNGILQTGSALTEILNGGGGGGASQTGSNATTTPNIGGKGGDGIPSVITGTLTYYGGGGGGSRYINGVSSSATGGLGGGGNGAYYFDLFGHPQGAATNGLPNTGGGGGAGVYKNGFLNANEFGGSGIVVVRYKTSEMTATSLNGTITTDGDYTIHTFTGSGAMYWPESGSGEFQRTDGFAPIATSSLLHYFNANQLASASRWEDIRTENTEGVFSSQSIKLITDAPSSSYYDFASSSLVQNMNFGPGPVGSGASRTVLLWIKPQKVGLTDEPQVLQLMGQLPGTLNNSLMIVSGGLAYKAQKPFLPFAEQTAIQGDFPSMSVDTWYQVGYSFDSSGPADEIMLYQNELTSSITGSSAVLAQNLYWEMGEVTGLPYPGFGVGTTFKYSGSIAIQMIYTSSLTHDEVKQNYNYFNQFYN